jgi:hypothetical protein
VRMCAGTRGGNVALYDMRSSRPLFVKEHQYGLPIHTVQFHSGSDTVLSVSYILLLRGFFSTCVYIIVCVCVCACVCRGHRRRCHHRIVARWIRGYIGQNNRLFHVHGNCAIHGSWDEGSFFFLVNGLFNWRVDSSTNNLPPSHEILLSHFTIRFYGMWP